MDGQRGYRLGASAPFGSLAPPVVLVELVRSWSFRPGTMTGPFIGMTQYTLALPYLAM